MKFRNSIYSFIGVAAAALLFSCSSSHEKTEVVPPTVPVESTLAPPPSDLSAGKMELRIIEIIDIATGKTGGWGYDIYVDGKVSIHQPIIPGIPGNGTFATAELAEKTGTLAMNKMKQTGGLPTITAKELDSLGVTR